MFITKKSKSSSRKPIKRVTRNVPAEPVVESEKIIVNEVKKKPSTKGKKEKPVVEPVIVSEPVIDEPKNKE